MFNWFSKKSKNDDLTNDDNFKNFIVDSLKGLAGRINSPEQLYAFVIEDACGAAQGNNTAQEFVRSSGLHLVEYENALNNSSTMDDDDSALDYMNNTISPQLIGQFGLENAIKMRCHLVKNFLAIHKNDLDQIRLKVAKEKLSTSLERHVSRRNENEWLAVVHSLGGSFSSEKPKLKAKSIIGVIPRNNYTENGFFFDLHKDFEDFVLPNNKLPTEILMPVFYAIRICFAGMFAQGLATRENFIETDEHFFQHMLRIGQSLSREEQVEFQEESLDKAIEWFNSYRKIERLTSNLLIASAKQGLSLRDALNSAIDTWETDNFSEKLDLKILNPEFCAMFYTMGGWMPDDDYQELAEKAYAFLYSPLHPYTLLFKNRIK